MTKRIQYKDIEKYDKFNQENKWQFYKAFHNSLETTIARNDEVSSIRGQNLDIYVEKAKIERIETSKVQIERERLPEYLENLIALQNKKNGKWESKKDVLRCLGLPTTIKFEYGYEWEQATAIALTAIRQNIELFHLLQDSHDLGYSNIQYLSNTDYERIMTIAKDIVFSYLEAFKNTSNIDNLNINSENYQDIDVLSSEREDNIRDLYENSRDVNIVNHVDSDNDSNSDVDIDDSVVVNNRTEFQYKPSNSISYYWNTQDTVNDHDNSNQLKPALLQNYDLPDKLYTNSMNEPDTAVDLTIIDANSSKSITASQSDDKLQQKPIIISTLDVSPEYIISQIQYHESRLEKMQVCILKYDLSSSLSLSILLLFFS